MDFSHYEQTSDTCGASSLLSILHHFDSENFSLSTDLEDEIYEECKVGKHVSQSGSMRKGQPLTPGRRRRMGVDEGANTMPGLAEYALDQDFNARLYQQNKEFEYVPDWTREGFSKMEIAYNRFKSDAEEKGLEVVYGDFNVKELLEEEVDNGRPVMLWMPYSGPMYHVITAFDRNGDDVRVMDPLEEENINRQIKDLDEKMERVPSNIGKKALAVWK